MGIPVGSRTGSSGSPRIMLDGKLYHGHRLAFFYMTGRNPDYIGFKDFNPNNLKWSNLEQISKKEHQLRQKALQASPVDNLCPIAKSWTSGQWYLQHRGSDGVVHKGPYFDDPREAVVEWAKLDEALIRQHRKAYDESKKEKTRRAVFSEEAMYKAIEGYLHK